MANSGSGRGARTTGLLEEAERGWYSGGLWAVGPDRRRGAGAAAAAANGARASAPAAGGLPLS